jgi:hypothetical protein
MRLILDEHVSPDIAQGLREDGIDVVDVSNWLSGTLRSTEDDHILAIAVEEHRVLVSFDVNTIPPLIGVWSEQGRHHAGVILMSRKTFRQNDVSGILRSLRALIAEKGNEDWQDRLEFLRR